MPSAPRVKKRLIVCCDGTWMDSDHGYVKPSHDHPKGTLQVPSNVTRISRCFKRRCSDGTLQVISYLSGVGTGSTLDTVTGGLFGQGLSERVREAYSYLCANYSDGDEIVLVGFSRGAFTARSVAGIIGNLGLLTREGVENFYPIFKDMQNWMNNDYDDPFPTLPFTKKPKGHDAAETYRRRLEKMGLTRVTQKSGDLIKIKAVCVWDTVGSLGIPNVGWLDKIGIRPSNDDTFKWHDTDLSDRIEHAFQALALDETRTPFTPAVWERRPQNKLTTDLRQVWFPGNHGNIGGGWEDQSMSNISLAWMMDQMASIGAEFDKTSLDRIFRQATEYFHSLSAMAEEHGLPQPPQWAIDPIYSTNRPVRPWGLGEIQQTSGVVHWLGGNEVRTPGLYKQTDPELNHDKNKFLLDTNERVHSSVRIRLTCGGLGLNDQSQWSCAAMSNWRLRRTSTKYKDPVPRNPTWGMNGGDSDKYAGRRPNEKEGDRYIWEYAGSERYAPTDPKQRIMVEEPLGPYERYLLKFSGGKPNVYEFSEGREVMHQPQQEKRRGKGDKDRGKGRRYADSESDSEDDYRPSDRRRSKR